ncbi:MAG: magnesium transporter [Candidatus Thorarchaeota archaeon]
MFGSIITGSLWASISPSLLTLAGVLALLPVIGNMRGNISGIFSSRLGTGLNIGTIHPHIKEWSPDLTKTVLSNIFSSIITPIWVALIVWVIQLIFFSITTSFTNFIIIALIASIFSVTLTVPLTLIISFAIYRRGIDPDVLGYPLISNIADIITVLGVLFAFYFNGAIYNSFIRTFEIIFEIFIILILIFSLIIIFSRNKNRNQYEIFNLLREVIPVLFLVAIISSFVGVLFNANLRYTGIMIIVPVFMSYTGATASVIGSRYTTAYFLGVLQSSSGRRSVYFTDPSIVFIIGLVLSTILGMVAYGISFIFDLTLPPGYTFLSYLLVCWITGSISTLFSILSSLIVGNVVFRRGIDADNVIVPISSTLGDLVALLGILFSLALIS